MQEPAIEVRRLRKIFPSGVEAVKGIDFDVAPGEVFGLLGPNGAGKSTTIGMLTTTVVPTAGTARLAGFDLATQPRAARRARSPDPLRAPRRHRRAPGRDRHDDPAHHPLPRRGRAALRPGGDHA